MTEKIKTRREERGFESLLLYELLNKQKMSITQFTDYTVTGMIVLVLLFCIVTIVKEFIKK